MTARAKEKADRVHERGRCAASERPGRRRKQKNALVVEFNIFCY